MKKEKNSGTFTFRITEEQQRYLEEAQRAIEQTTGVGVSKAWLVITLMDFGKMPFERKYSLSSKSQRKSA